MKNNNQKKHQGEAPSLLKEIVVDLFFRHWLVTGLVLLFIGSSIQLVLTTHNNRKLTAQWQSLKQTHHDQQLAWEALRLELTALTEPDRISSQAKKKLQMVEVTTKNEKVIAL